MNGRLPNDYGNNATNIAAATRRRLFSTIVEGVTRLIYSRAPMEDR